MVIVQVVGPFLTGISLLLLGPDFDSRYYYDFIKRMFLKNAGSRTVNTRAISAVDPDSCKPVITDLQNAIGESKNRKSNMVL